MSSIIRANNLNKKFDQITAVNSVDLEVKAGSIVGLIGPNGAGKTTLLRALLGLSAYDGELDVLGNSPRRERAQLMEKVCFIADTAVLPRWMNVAQLLDYCSGIHPRFKRAQAEALLASSEIKATRRIRTLSKGMMVQLHLALVMAIDAQLLILDEPTLGLDILFRKRFFEQLLDDYFDGERTIIISTHQVEEVQNILTDVIFMNRGRIILNSTMRGIEEQFIEVHVLGDNVDKALDIPHVGERTILGGKAIIYEGITEQLLFSLGEIRTPAIADLFVAKVTGDAQHV